MNKLFVFLPLEVCFNRSQFLPSVSWSGQSRSCPVLSSKRIFTGRPPTMVILEGLNGSFESFLPRGQAISVDCHGPPVSDNMCRLHDCAPPNIVVAGSWINSRLHSCPKIPAILHDRNRKKTAMPRFKPPDLKTWLEKCHWLCEALDRSATKAWLV